jgi:signal transduction histidine kinase
MRSSYAPRRIFLLALALLLLSAFSATWIIYRLYMTEALVRHTYNVLLSIDSVTSDLAKAGRYRMAFLEKGDTALVDEYMAASDSVHSGISKLRSMIADNPEELVNTGKLEAAANDRLQVLKESIEKKRAGLSDPQEQAASTSEVVKSSFEAAAIASQMKEVEETLLERRATLTFKLFQTMLAILLLTFSLALFLLFSYYRVLQEELRERTNAEANAQRLSVLVMTMQDEERRKFARELHDSLGQNLTAAKILADQMVRKLPGEKSLSELQSIVTDTLTETRTISHLLHPPLLDEMGFATAARWYIDGYAKRTGISVAVDMPDEPARMSRILELTLFRVLQESLTNIHRHSKSNKAEVSYVVNPAELTLKVRDFGVGIPEKTLSTFAADGSSVGIGLAGMRERVREQGGVLAVESGPQGTTVNVMFTHPARAKVTDHNSLSATSAPWQNNPTALP